MLPPASFPLLLDALAIAGFVISASDPQGASRYRLQMQQLEQSILHQAKCTGLADEVWSDPDEGLLHHSRFEGQEGDAWQAVERFCEENFLLEFSQRMALVLTEREGVEEELCEERRLHHEQRVLAMLRDGGFRSLVAVVPDA